MVASVHQSHVKNAMTSCTHSSRRYNGSRVQVPSQLLISQTWSVLLVRWNMIWWSSWTLDCSIISRLKLLPIFVITHLDIHWTMVLTVLGRLVQEQHHIPSVTMNHWRQPPWHVTSYLHCNWHMIPMGWMSHYSIEWQDAWLRACQFHQRLH